MVKKVAVLVAMGVGLLALVSLAIGGNYDLEKLEKEMRPYTARDWYTEGLRARAERIKTLGEVCDSVKAGYEKDKVPSHRMDNYWRCLEVQGISLFNDGRYTERRIRAEGF